MKPFVSVRIAWQKLNIWGRMKLLWHLNFLWFYIQYRLGWVKNYQIKTHTDWRIDYYCKLSAGNRFPTTTTLNQIKLRGGAGYGYDFYRIMACFNRPRFNYLFGDITFVPEIPSFVKSRPIMEANENSVVLPLDIYRHLHFRNDPGRYRYKLNMAVWRGHTYQRHRQAFLAAAERLYFCNVLDTSQANLAEHPGLWMSVEEQLRYKIIFSVEGAEVATNLKWIMGSQSLCFMCRPKYETWFREGLLTPGVHYVEIADDFSDITAKFNHYTTHIDEAEAIIRNANAYVNEFRDPQAQYDLAQAVAFKYLGMN